MPESREIVLAPFGQFIGLVDWLGHGNGQVDNLFWECSFGQRIQLIMEGETWCEKDSDIMSD
jgi:hypothetical protein